MSLWKFNDFEYDLDFTDADFAERLEVCYEKFIEAHKNVKKTGRNSEVIRSYCQTCFDFFDDLFGTGTHKKLFGNKVSMDMCVDAMNSFSDMNNKQSERYKKFIIQNNQNRQQRRYYQKHGRK